MEYVLLCWRYKPTNYVGKGDRYLILNRYLLELITEENNRPSKLFEYWLEVG